MRAKKKRKDGDRGGRGRGRGVKGSVFILVQVSLLVKVVVFWWRKSFLENKFEKRVIVQKRNLIDITETNPAMQLGLLGLKGPILCTV